MGIDVAEQLCQAVDTIVNERLKTVACDITLTCTIVDDSNKANGIYQVSNGSAKFIAYSQNTTYKNDDVVYVEVPNGNYDNDKIIVSKKPNDSDKPISYIRPFDKFVSITGNIVTGLDDQSFGLVANSTAKTAIPIWSYNLSEDDSYYKSIGSDIAGYTRLALQGSMMAWLKDLSAVTGSYGLLLEIQAIPEDENGLEKDETELETKYYNYRFDCSQMPGNPYQYDSFYEQQIVFDISEIYKIRTMQLSFYQKPGTFETIEGDLIPWEGLMPNLYVKDIYVSFGYDSEEFEDNQIVIYSLDSTQYIATEDPEEDNHKKIELRWVHRDDDGEIKVVNLNSGIDYELTWYRRVLGHRSDTVYSGVDWAQLSTQIVERGKAYYEIKDADWLSYNEIAAPASNPTGIPRNPDYNQTWLLPDITMAEERVKAIIIYNDQPYYSNVLSFTNRREVVSKPTVEAIQALSINCEDNTYGNYLIYNLGGSLIDNADSSKVREFKAYFKSADDDSDIATQLTEAQQIEWIIPITNTMIVLDDEFLGADYKDDEAGFRHIFRYGETDGSIYNQNSQRYKINSHYTQAYNKNTITCKVTKDKTVYTAVKELVFGPAGTSGTDYTFVLDFNNGATALTIGDETAITARARLYNYDGSEMAGLENEDIVWTWMNGDNDLMEAPIRQTKHNYAELKLKSSVTSIPVHNHCILKATLAYATKNGKFNLEAYLPIPIRSSKQYSFISGATTIRYNSLGYLEGYYQMPYAIYGEDTDTKAWEVFNGASWTLNDTSSDMAPTMSDNYVLKPKKSYAEDSRLKEICVTGYLNGQAVWIQPIYIYQNKYPSSIVNDWDGELKIDNDNNAILAAKVIAGKKESDNTFTGVLMGDWSDKNNDIESGLFGFDKGSSTFGFRTDGTAYIGTANSGRLEFDGNKSTLQSSLYAISKGGMGMDFDDGWIKMYAKDGFNSSSKYISIDTGASVTPFKIGNSFSVDWDGTITASDGNFYGSIDSEYIHAGGIDIDSILTADAAQFNSLSLEEPLYVGAVYFAKTTALTETVYKYFTRSSSSSSWRAATKEEYDAVTDSNLKKKQEAKKGGVTTVYSGYAGVIPTAAGSGVGIQNRDSSQATVLEGYGNNLRIGNNKVNGASSYDSIIIQGKQIENLIEDNGIYYIGQPSAIKIQGKSGTTTLTVSGIDPEDQTGIYARFA